MERSLWDRAGDLGGLEGLSRPSSQLRGPEKKKRKSSVQGSALPPLSEYAPPMNTSSNHLIASNPFDDDYSVSSLSGYTYFGKPGYANIESFHNFKMPPNTSPKRSSRNGGTQSFRDQPLSFSKDIKGMQLGKTFSFDVTMQDKLNFENESFFSSGLGHTIVMPGQHFRPNYNQEVYHMTSLNSGQRNDFQVSSYRPQVGKVNFNHQLESNHPFPQTPPPFMHPTMSNPKQDFISVHIKNFSLNSATSEDQTNSDHLTYSSANTKSCKKQLVGKKISQSDTVDLTICGTNGTRSKPSRLAKSDVTPREKCNRWLLQSSFCSNVSTDTLYPCGICCIEVNNFEDAIMCEVSCQKWFHRTCTGLTEVAYTLLTAEASAIWGCDSCMAKKDVQLVHTRK
ncbi:pygopus homolog 1 [Pseudophryne corroboree]|uniref:pygopus homolog 1 n=1 Tax=Pseudophryne corroboree TaxID=495146 RepID=UPI0030813BAF